MLVCVCRSSHLWRTDSWAERVLLASCLCTHRPPFPTSPWACQPPVPPAWVHLSFSRHREAPVWSIRGPHVAFSTIGVSERAFWETITDRGSLTQAKHNLQGDLLCPRFFWNYALSFSIHIGGIWPTGWWQNGSARLTARNTHNHSVHARSPPAFLPGRVHLRAGGRLGTQHSPAAYGASGAVGCTELPGRRSVAVIITNRPTETFLLKLSSGKTESEENVYNIYP